MSREVVVKGYTEFLRACAKADKETRRAVRKELRKAGDVVKLDAQRKFALFELRTHSSARSASGFRTVIRQRGISVEQSLRKTTGKHPEWGALQMTKALIPARDDKEHAVERAFDQATDRICDRFERGH